MRAVITGAFLLFAFGGAFLRHVVGVRVSALPKWQMFSGKSLDVVRAQLFVPDGEDEVHVAMDRSNTKTVFPLSPALFYPVDLRRVARQACHAHEDVRAKAVRMTKRGWVEFEDGTHNICGK